MLWQPAPDNLQVEGGGLALCASLDLSADRVGQLTRLLSTDEKVRAGRFHLERDRDRFIAGRGQLREILGRLLGVGGEQIVFSNGLFGKPRMAGLKGCSLRFNLAHSGPLVVYAIDSQHEVGVDVEQIRPLREAAEIAARYFSATELGSWRDASPERQMEDFFLIWTRKEAYLKAIGRGLDGLMSQIEAIAPLLNEVAGFEQWSLQTLTPAAAYVGTLATKNPAGVSCWSW